jgi:hypothetical protein
LSTWERGTKSALVSGEGGTCVGVVLDVDADAKVAEGQEAGRVHAEVGQLLVGVELAEHLIKRAVKQSLAQIPVIAGGS